MSSQFSEKSNIRTRHAHTNFPLGSNGEKKIKVWGECYFSRVKYSTCMGRTFMHFHSVSSSCFWFNPRNGGRICMRIYSPIFSAVGRSGEKGKRNKVFLPHTPKFLSDQLKTILFSPAWFSSIHSFPTATTNRLKIFSPIPTSYKGKHNFQASLWVELPPADGKRLLVVGHFNPSPP